MELKNQPPLKSILVSFLFPLYFLLFEPYLFGPCLFPESSHLSFKFLLLVLQIFHLFLQSCVEEENFRMRDEFPLSGLILTKQFPPKFKLAVLDKYGGIIDSRSYVENFRTITMLQNINDYHLCRVFSATLIALAQKMVPTTQAWIDSKLPL
ncbi:hypothetical protein P3X46_034045, partial [Hevea brasiliensis]